MHHINDEPRFWAHQQTAPWIPQRATCQDREPHSPRWQGASREARRKRPLPMRLGTALSSAAVAAPGATTGRQAGTTFRDRRWTPKHVREPTPTGYLTLTRREHETPPPADTTW